MGGLSATETREPLAGLGVDGRHEELRLPQGPSDLPSLAARTDLIDISMGTDPGRDLHQVNQNNVNALVFGELSANAIADHYSSRLSGEGNPLPHLNGNFEEVGGPGLHEAGRLPPPTANHMQDHVQISAGQDTEMRERDLTRERTSMEDLLNANCKETLVHFDVHANIRTLLQELEDAQKQKGLLRTKENEVLTLKRENQQLLERSTKLHSDVLHDMSELRSTICEMKTAIEQLRQNVTSQQSVCDEVLEREVGKVFLQVCRENRAHKENLLKCRTELESVKHTRTIEIKEEEEKQIILAEANGKLQEKVDKIQKELCKERDGQHGSYLDGQQTPSLLERTAKEVFSSIAKFSNLLSKYKGPHGDLLYRSWILESDIWKASRAPRQQHWTYLLKHYISIHMFRSFECESFVQSYDYALFVDPCERMSTCFEYFKSCRTEPAATLKGEPKFFHVNCTSNPGSKLDELQGYLFFQYLELVSDEILPEDIKPIFWEIIENYSSFTSARLGDLLSRLATDKQKLVKSFIVVAEKVWQFHKLCLSFESPATIFRVQSGDPFNQNYMESTEALEKDSTPPVGFMVYPGFRLRKSIIKCEVYVAIT